MLQSSVDAVIYACVSDFLNPFQSHLFSGSAGILIQIYFVDMVGKLIHLKLKLRNR
jgi:hypothetical protein